MPQQRRRIRHEKTFQERLAEEALRFKVAAQNLLPGTCPKSCAPCPASRDRIAYQRVGEFTGIAAPKSFGKRAVRSEQVSQVVHMQDYLAALERLRKDAAEAALIRDLTTDKAKRDFFDRLHRHLDMLADEIEQAMNAPKMA